MSERHSVTCIAPKDWTFPWLEVSLFVDLTFLSNMYTGVLSLLLSSQVRSRNSSQTSVMSLTVVLVVVLVLQERVLITAVRGKRYCRDTQTGEAGLEPVPSAEESRVPPVLTVKFPPSVVLIDRRGLSRATDYRSQGS